jgi:hypothetical protein
MLTRRADGNISGEATTGPGNIFPEAMRTLKLPGVTLARINEESQAWRQACAHPTAPHWMRDQIDSCRAAVANPVLSRPHPRLRLVVDNTRSEMSPE